MPPDARTQVISGGPGNDGWAHVAFPPNCPWGPGGGAILRAAPTNFQALAAQLSYEVRALVSNEWLMRSGRLTTSPTPVQVYFDDKFDWGTGGTLPGLVGGAGDSPGGNWAANGSSFRVQWGPNGNAFAGVHFEVRGKEGADWNEQPPLLKEVSVLTSWS